MFASSFPSLEIIASSCSFSEIVRDSAFFIAGIFRRKGLSDMNTSPSI